MVTLGIRAVALLLLSIAVGYEYVQYDHHIVILLASVALLVMAANDGVALYRKYRKPIGSHPVVS